MPSLNQYERAKCDNCGTQTTKHNIARHKKRCSGGSMYCSQRPNFFTKSQNDLNYQIAKKRSAPNLISPSSVNFVMQNFRVLCFMSTQKHSTRRPMGFGLSEIHVEDIVGDVNDQSLREELNLANTFWQILKWRMEDTETSTLPCHPSSFLCSTINWIIYSRNWNVLQKLTLHLDSFWKILRMECEDALTLTRSKF